MSADLDELTNLRRQIEELKAQLASPSALTANYNALKAAADAKAASITAESIAQKALFQTVAGSTAATGTISPGQGSGAGEATLLAARILQEIAEKIAAQVSATPLETDGRFIVFAGTQRPTFGRWRAFQALIDEIIIAFSRSDEEIALAQDLEKNAEVLENARQPDDNKESAVPFTAAGAIFDFGVKLGSYFLTDYTTSAVTLTGVTDDFLAVAVVGKLINAWYPARWAPPTPDGELATLLEKVNGPQRASVEKLKLAQRSTIAYADLSAREQDIGRKERFQKISEAYEKAGLAVTAAQKLVTDLIAAVMVADAQGFPLLTYIIEEKTISDRFKAGDKALILQVNTTVGTVYTKKNIWTFLGEMPFYVRGGVLVSYLLVDPKTGNILKSAQFSEQSHFCKLSKIV
ncbi:hypothetical protein NKH85_12510 [Mesorhizobium sp. M0924]|uniref:hypothetical protein n=1 Tax=unclassified Mesorhizobium TaxID=325217 RepID=UPI00333AB88F